MVPRASKQARVKWMSDRRRTDLGKAQIAVEHVQWQANDKYPRVLREGWGDVAGEEGLYILFFFCLSLSFSLSFGSIPRIGFSYW